MASSDGSSFQEATLHIVYLGTFINDDERTLELPDISGIQAEIRLQGQVHLDALGYIDERTTRPDCAVQCGKLVILDRDDGAEIFAEEIRMFAQSVFDRQENNTLLFEVFQKGVVDHLRIMDDQSFSNKVMRAVHFKVVDQFHTGGFNGFNTGITKILIHMVPKTSPCSHGIIMMELALVHPRQPLF